MKFFVHFLSLHFNQQWWKICPGLCNYSVLVVLVMNLARGWKPLRDCRPRILKMIFQYLRLISENFWIFNASLYDQPSFSHQHRLPLFLFVPFISYLISNNRFLNPFCRCQFHKICNFRFIFSLSLANTDGNVHRRLLF